MSPIDPLRLGLGLFTMPQSEKRRRGTKSAAGLSGGQAAASRTDSAATDAQEHAALPTSIMALAQALTDAEERLVGEADSRALEDYRSAVSRFLRLATEDALKLQHETTLGLSQRIFATITRSNILLGELTDAVLGRQRDSARIRSLAGQIKGLLLDLYR